MAQSQPVPVRETLHKLFPAEFLIALAKATAAVQRVRKVKPVDLFWTVVLGFGVGRERTIAGLRRSYEKTTGQTIEESSFYDGFTPGFAKMVKQAALRALELGVGASRALQGHLAGFRVRFSPTRPSCDCTTCSRRPTPALGTTTARPLSRPTGS